uniref:Fork-head domain-containing protein n=1 Tax=Schizaphis graminum TaxID=13262 RepID=A0A2S2NYG3_SCHGA
MNNTDNMMKQYNAMHEHNYFYDNNKIKNQRHNEEINHTEKIINDYDECDSTLDWFRDLSSSDEDEEEDVKNMPLSHLLRIELENDLAKEYKNKKSSKDQLYDELNDRNNHTMLNISNNSNNIISENHLINNGKQRKIVQLVPLTNDSTIIQNQNITNESQTILFVQPCKDLVVENNLTYIKLLPNVFMNTNLRTDHINNNLQGVNFSLDTNNPIVEKDNVNVTKTSANIVCPPLNWIHLIYLAIKNSATENVSFLDIQRFVRYWFPFYKKNSYIRYIQIILSHIINDFHEKYFYCNSFPIDINKHDTWTINSIYINTLEKSLIKIVENNEDKIKSAMTNPDKLSTIVNGYGVFYLGFNQNL